MRNAFEDVTGEIVQTAKNAVEDSLPTVQRWVTNLLLTIWSLLWGLVFALGWAFHSPATLGVSAVALGAVWARVIVKRRRARRALELRARTSLVARAQLDGLRLPRPMVAALSAFDVHQRRIAALTDEPGVREVEVGLELQADVARAGDHVYALARAHAEIDAELTSLKRHGAQPAVASAREELARELARLEGEANRVVIDSQRLAERLAAVKALSGQDQRAAERSLGDAVEDLDRTVAAYREIESDPLEEARRRVRRIQGLGQRSK